MALASLPHVSKLLHIPFFFLLPWASGHPPWRSLPTHPPQKFRPCIWIMPGQALSELSSKHWPHLASLCAKRAPLTLSSGGLSSHLPTGLEPSSLEDALETLTSSCLLSSLICPLLACLLAAVAVAAAGWLCPGVRRLSASSSLSFSLALALPSRRQSAHLTTRLEPSSVEDAG